MKTRTGGKLSRKVFAQTWIFVAMAASMLLIASVAMAQSTDGGGGSGSPEYRAEYRNLGGDTPSGQSQYQAGNQQPFGSTQTGFGGLGAEFSQGNPSFAGNQGMFGNPQLPWGASGGALEDNGAGLGGPALLNGGLSQEQLARALGLTTAELGGLENQLKSYPSPNQIQQLCLRLASRHLGPAEVSGIIGAMGINLTAAQMTQLRSCTGLASAPAPAQGHATAANPPLATQRRNPIVYSSIEKSFHALDSGAIPSVPSARNLKQFGYSLFDSQMISTFAPVQNVPVSNSYVLGPGDQLKVLIWGRVNDRLNLTVERNGSVMIPQIGPLQVAGLTFAQAKKLIEAQGDQITGVKVDVTMGRLRAIQVFVIGEVRHPGTYTISALSHVSNALAASGGITRIGSLRLIEVRRDNQVVRVVDLYDMLLHGDTADDIQLQQNDVIFVPVIGAVAAVAGDVKRPAIYELSHNSESLQRVLKLAGGISAFGYSQRVQVERVEEHRKRIALDIDLNDVRARHFRVRDGDLIKVYPVLPQQKDIVTVRGNVNRPGDYQWYPGITVDDLIHEAEGVAPHTFFRYALVRREVGPEKAVRVVPVNISNALADDPAGPADIQLNPQDRLTVFNQSQIKALPTVQVLGEVRNPGFYVLDHGMRVSDLIYLAGGLKDDAYLTKAELARTSVVGGSRTLHTYEDVNLQAALDGLDSNDPTLRSNDELFVRRASNWHLPWVVEVKGEVQRPGPYTIHAGERLASVLERAGGLLPDAYPQGAIFIRQSVKRMEQERLNQARQELRQAIARYELTPVGFSEGGKSRLNSKALTGLQKLLVKSQNEQAQGRLVIHLRPLDQLVNTRDNIVLEDHDEILIPRRPASVNILGQVYSPSAIVYQPSLTVRDYLERAGGPNENADIKHIFVVKADGSILTDAGIRNSTRGRMFPLLPLISGGLMEQHLEPGDTIFVPQKLLYVNKTRLYSNVAQIFASTAQTVAVFALAAGL